MAKKNEKTIHPTHRARVLYAGRVQGVGFRHTAEEKALSMGLTGWVKNLRDNRVELVCEGTKEKIEGFLEGIQGCHLGNGIKKADVRWETPTGEFRDFTVEFDL